MSSIYQSDFIFKIFLVGAITFPVVLYNNNNLFGGERRPEMLHVGLQVWGGIFYLLNKIFFSLAERSATLKNQKMWRIASWIVYLIGLPSWVIIFAQERNWIAAALEAGGTPAMTLGLVIALRGKGKEPKWLDWIAFIAILVGFSYSIHDFGGLTTINQWLEIGIVTGFLFGTYLLAKEYPSGYLWFVLMNGSNALLMYVESYPWLVVQQIISLGFVIGAYIINRKRVPVMQLVPKS